MLPFASLSAIVLAVFAVAGVDPCNAFAFKLATTVVEETTNGEVPVATVEVNLGAVTFVPSNTKDELVAVSLLEFKYTTALAVPPGNNIGPTTPGKPLTSTH